MLSKHVNNKKCAPKLVLFNEKKLRNIPMWQPETCRKPDSTGFCEASSCHVIDEPQGTFPSLISKRLWTHCALNFLKKKSQVAAS